MADFQTAFRKTIALEGGYRLYNHPKDRGKLTFAGIAVRYWPSWDGWELVESEGHAVTGRVEPSPTLKKRVKVFYLRNFWRRIHGDQIADQSKADSIYDFAVNAGVDRCSRIVQACVGVKVDGRIGARTLARINAADPDQFAMLFALTKVARYAEICNSDETQEEFLLGWVNRTLKVAQGVA